MSEEERQRRVDFVLNQQARFAADVQRSHEGQGERWERADRRCAETGRSIRALLASAEIHNQEIEENSVQMAALREAGRQTDERLNALLDTVGRVLSEGRDGGPGRG